MLQKDCEHKKGIAEVGKIWSEVLEDGILVKRKLERMGHDSCNTEIEKRQNWKKDSALLQLSFLALSLLLYLLFRLRGSLGDQYSWFPWMCVWVQGPL